MVARQIRQWAEFHKRAPCRLFLQPKRVSQTVGCPLLCPLLGAHKCSVSEECCFCDSSLVEVIRQMFSLWHQRSDFKWREIKQNIENKREINTTILLSPWWSLCVHFLDTFIIRIQGVDIKVHLSQWSVCSPESEEHATNQAMTPGTPGVFQEALLALDLATSIHTPLPPIQNSPILPPQRHSGRSSWWTKEQIYCICTPAKNWNKGVRTDVKWVTGIQHHLIWEKKKANIRSTL